MGELAIQATIKGFKNKKLSRYNQATLEMSKSQIEASMNNLKSEALMICNLEVDLNVTFNYSYVSSELPSHKQWLSSVTHELNSFIKSQLPGRQRLSVAIGVAKMIKNEHHYKSFTQPLIEAITALFNHLEFQSHTELSLLHLSAFQDVFVAMCRKAIEITRLTSFGPQYSSSSFSNLLSPKELKILANQINNSALGSMSSFRRQRIIRRLINHAQFQTSVTNTMSVRGVGKDWGCASSARRVSIMVPKIASNSLCLSKVNENKYKDKNGSFYLSDGSYALTATRHWTSLGDKHLGEVTKILQQPIIKVKNTTKGWLVTRNSIFFSENLNSTLQISCNGGHGNMSIAKKIASPGIFRIFDNCNYSSHSDLVSVTASNSLLRASTISPDLETLSSSSFSLIENSLSPEMCKMLENKFQNALSSEDNFQVSLEELKSQSWLKGWINSIIEAAMPAVVIFSCCLAAVAAIYIGCCCCPKKCRKAKNNDEDLVARVEKLEHFFTFYVNDNFHKLSSTDLLEAAKHEAT